MDMAISKQQWEELSWSDRVREAIKETACSQSSFARKIGVDRRTVGKWLDGKNNPNPGLHQVIEDICVVKDPVDFELGCYSALMTPAVDPSADIISLAISSRNTILLSSVAHCIASKLASMLLNTVPKQIVMTMESVFNSYPAKEVLRIDVVGHPDIKYEVTVTHQAAGPTAFTLLCQAFKGEQRTDQYATWVTDKGLLAAAKRIKSHIISLCRTQQHHPTN